MNILQVQDQLKGLSQDQLVREMQQPSGSAPQYLVLSELNRRKKMQADMAAQQSKAPQTTVAQDAVAAAGVPQGGITALAANMAPKTDITGNTGASPIPAPMPSEAPVGMADGGKVGYARGTVINGIPYELLPSGEVVRAGTAESASPSEAAAVMAKLNPQFTTGQVFDSGRPVLDQAAVGEFSLNPADPMQAIKERALFEQGVNPSHAYDLAQQAYGIGISDRRPDIMPGIVSLPTVAPVAGYAPQGVPAMAAGVPTSGDVYPQIPTPWTPADIMLAASAGPMTPITLPFQGATVANQSEAMPPVLRAEDPLASTTLDPFEVRRNLASGYRDVLKGQTIVPTGENQMFVYGESPQTPVSSYDNMPRMSADIDPAGLWTALIGPTNYAMRADELLQTGEISPDQYTRLTRGSRAEQGKVIREALGYATETPLSPPQAPIAEQETAAKAESDAARAAAAEEARAANEAAAGVDAGTPLTAADVVAPPASPDAVTTPPGGPSGGGTQTSGGAGAGGFGGMSAYEQAITEAIDRADKRAEQDKWLALAQAGMEIMNAASHQGTFAGAVGEGGAKGISAFRQGRDDAENTRLGLLKELEASRLARAQLAARAAGGSSSRGALTMNQALSQAGDLMTQGQELVQMGTATKNADMVAQGEQIKAYAQSLMGMVFPAGTGGGGTIPTP